MKIIERHDARVAYAFLTGLALLVYGYNIGGMALTEHELQTGSCARAMILTGDWLLPRMGHLLWLEKPPLSPWLAALSATLLGGFTETTVRLPSMLAGTGIVLLIAHLSSRWFGPTVALLAGVVQATTFYTVTYARLAEADIVLALIVVAGITAFVHLQAIAENDARQKRRWAFVFWTLVGLSNLVKVPLFGAGLILGPSIVWLISQRSWALWRRVLSPIGMPMALALAVGWPALAMTRVSNDLALWSVVYVPRRALGQVVASEPWWYYATTIPWQLLPWTIAPLFAALPSLRRAWRDPDSPDRFIWCWAIVPLITLSLFPGKHHHFLIHSLPAFSPLAALGLVRLGQLIADRLKMLMVSTWLSVAGIPLAALTAAAYAGARIPDVRLDFWMMGLIVGASAVVISTLGLRRQPRAALAGLVVSTVLILFQFHGRIQPAFDGSRQDRAFLKGISALVPADAPLVAVGGVETARHVFYCRPTLHTVSLPAEITSRAQGADAVYVLARARDRATLLPLGLVTDVAQSEHTRGERSSADRFALFRIVLPASDSVRVGQ